MGRNKFKGFRGKKASKSKQRVMVCNFDKI